MLMNIPYVNVFVTYFHMRNDSSFPPLFKIQYCTSIFYTRIPESLNWDQDFLEWHIGLDTYSSFPKDIQ